MMIFGIFINKEKEAVLAVFSHFWASIFNMEQARAQVACAHQNFFVNYKFA